MSFIFQSKPVRYDLREVLRPGHRVSWVASRYRDSMRVGEVVYFWLSGERSLRGIYGWGRITGDHPEPDHNQIFRIHVTYFRNFLDHHSRQHISVDEIEADDVLSAMVILRLPMGTNFLLRADEDDALRRLIRRKYGDDWVPPATKNGAEPHE